MLREPRAVVVDAHFAVVDRRHSLLRIARVLRVDVRERRRLVRVEEVSREGAREEVVVDAEEDVALRVAGGQQRRRQRLTRVARLQDAELQAGLVLERLPLRLRDDERVVGDEDDVLRRPSAAAAAREPRRARRPRRRRRDAASRRCRLRSGTHREDDSALHGDLRPLGGEDVRDAAARPWLEGLPGERVERGPRCGSPPPARAALRASGALRACLRTIERRGRRALGPARPTRRAPLPRTSRLRGGGTSRGGGRAVRLRRPRRGSARGASRARRRGRARGRSRPSRAGSARQGSPSTPPPRRRPGTRSPDPPPRGRPPGRAPTRARDRRRRRSRSRRRERRAPPRVPEPARLPPPPRSRSTRLPPLALPRSGSAGRRRVRPPSQPGCPELPVTLGTS